MTPLPRAARSYICAVLVAGLAACVVAALNVQRPLDVLGLAALIVVCCSVSDASVDSGSVSLSLGFVVTIAAILVTGAAGAVVVTAASALQYIRGGQPLVKRAFNAGQYAVSAGCAGLVYTACRGPVHELSERDFPRILFLLVLIVLVYAFVNHLLVWTVMRLTAPPTVQHRIGSVIPWSAAPDFVYGFLSLLMADLWENVNPATAMLLLIPLMVTRSTFAAFVEQKRAYDATVAALIQAIETKDHYTRGHSERVSRGSVMIARQLGLRQEKVEALRYAGMLHDVGKMGVPTRVLQKQGRLSTTEADAVRAHPARGLDMLGDIAFLQEALSGIYHHHERMDGRGYPLGLRGHEIPEFARVIMVADAFDSMTSNRSYRAAMDIEAAIGELVACAGTQFDPVMVEAMVEALHAHGWQVQGATERRLPAPDAGRPVPTTTTTTTRTTTTTVPVPRAVVAYSSVEVE